MRKIELRIRCTDELKIIRWLLKTKSTDRLPLHQQMKIVDLRKKINELINS
jgi:hypothetical protein